LAASDGKYSAMIVNTVNSNAYNDELIGQPIDMTKITGPNLVFVFSTAYAKRVSTSADKIEVFLSKDCGKTWDIRLYLPAIKLTNGLIDTGNFIPTPNQWIQQSLAITGLYATCKNLLYKIRFTSNNGNNIYLDNIMITGSLGIKEELAGKINLNIYPNPLEENSVVSFDLEKSEHVSINIQDMIGRKMFNVFEGNLNAGEHQYTVLEKPKLAAGVYFMNITVGNQFTTKKLIVNE
jgi:hypothetical protein